MSFDFGSLEKKSNTPKTTKPSAGTHKSVSSGKPETQVPSFDFLNKGEQKVQVSKPQVSPQAKPQAKPQLSPQAKPQAKPQVSPQPKPQAKPQVSPQAKPQAKPQETKPHLEPIQESKPHSTAPVKSTPATINLQTESKSTTKPVVSGLESLSKPTPKLAPKPVTQTKQESVTSGPSFNFGTPNSSTSQPFIKTASKPTAKSTHNSHSSKEYHKGKRSSSPLDALKDINPMALSAGIGGIAVLLITIVCICCMGGGAKKAPNHTSNDKWKAHINVAYELTNKGEYQKAIAEYEKAYKLNPTDNYAPDQISVIYRQYLHDETQAEYWKSISDNNQVGNLENMEGKGTQFYEEKAAKKKARQGKR